MSAIAETPIDTARLEQFVFQAVDEVGATLNAALVVMGDRLGLYRGLAGAGAMTSEELATRTGTSERYVREWLNCQAAGGYVEYHAAEGSYSLAPEQTVALTDESSPAYLPGFFELALGSVLDSLRITDAVRSGAGVGWHEHSHHVHNGCERFFRPGYNANLIDAWLSDRPSRHRRRLHPVPPGRRDALQPRLRSATLMMLRSRRGRHGPSRSAWPGRSCRPRAHRRRRSRWAAR